ncbi:MAG: 1-acyl-sn-glycerol-3-phosphate acyltransferase [Bacteroidota bacterium]
MEDIFLGIYHFFSQYKLAFWAILLGVCLPVFYLASHIRLEQDITKILPGSNDSQEYQQVLKQSGMMEKLVVRVSLADSAEADPDKLAAYAAAFIQQLQNRKDLQPLIKEIRDRVPDEVMMKAYQLFYNNLPYFLDEQDYLVLDTLITDTSVALSLQKDYHTLMSPMSLAVKRQITSDPLHFTARALTKLQSLQINQAFELYDGYIVSKDRKSLLLLISPANPPNETTKNGQLIDGIDQTIQQLATKEFSMVQTEYFGASAVAVANAKQIQKDIYLTVSLAIFCICLLLWVYFRKASLPLVILLPVLFGSGFAVAIIYLIKESISSIAIGGGAIIIGIAVNYSLHVFTHYKHTRSLTTVIKDLSTPLLIGNISTVGAFFGLLFVKSDLLFDFGLFSGLSLIGAILFTLVFLPTFLSFYSMPVKEKEDAWLEQVESKWTPFTKSFTKFSVLIILVVSSLFLFTFQNVPFENDLNALNFMSPELKKAEKHLLTEGNESERSIYLLFEGKNLNEALTRNEKALTKIKALMQQKTVVNYFGVTAILVSDSVQNQRKERWENYWTSVKKEKLKASLATLAPQYGFKPTAFNDFFALLDKQFDALSLAEIEEVKAYFLKDYLSTSADKSTVIMAALKVPVSQSDKVYAALATEKDLYILDKQFIIKKFISILDDDFNQILYTSSLLVFTILLLFYGRIELALIAFVPMMLSWLWILGLMNVFDLRFNIVNIIISTFIFGLGDDFTIFMMDGHLGEYKDGTKNLPSFKVSILLAALTTLFGMGVLIFAKHPALQSIAVISVLGIACVLFISYTVIPILFRGLIGNRAKKGLVPLTAFSLLMTVMVFVFFLFGCFTLIITGFILFKIFRLKGSKAKLFYHYLIMYFTRFSLYSGFNVKKQWINTSGEKFAKPAIIIANHQSFLDILVLLASHPKIVLFTNDWVWNSPFFGPVVRMAGFFRVGDGVESGFEMVKKTIDMGYSVAIFPEGSRSADCEIKRFHKGAFFLAEQLQLDIVPVVIHGTGNTMAKHDFILKPGVLTVKILPRITAANPQYGATYQERTKGICKMLREEYQEVRQAIETPDFFRYRLMQKYIYKGAVLEWYTRIKLKLEKNYQVMHTLVPTKGRIYDVGCGYGFLSYMLAFMSAERQITGIDYDEQKVGVADHSKSDTPNVSFFASDALTFAYQNADAFIISDVLHYIPKESQETLIKLCIQKLNPGGVLIVRDADASLQKRHRGTRLSEFFSVTLFGFNKSDSKQLHFISSQEMFDMLKPLSVEVKILDQTKLNSNIIYYIQKQVVSITASSF